MFEYPSVFQLLVLAHKNLVWYFKQIEGDFVAVKKALIAVSRRLQDSPPVGRTPEVDPQEILADGRMDVPPVRNFVPQPNSGSSHAPGRPFSSDANQHPNTNLRMPQQEVTFRILCSHERVGVIIGKQGMVVRALQNESGASINVASPVPDCKERLVTITATEVCMVKNFVAFCFHFCWILLIVCVLSFCLFYSYRMQSRGIQLHKMLLFSSSIDLRMLAIQRESIQVENDHLLLHKL